MISKALLRRDGKNIEIEHRWLFPDWEDKPVLVFLHEGLGSVAMWRDFPERVCKAIECRGLVYSRYGYGQSTQRPLHEHWPPSFMHREAIETLPALLGALGIDGPRDRPFLFGHSDGGSIALIHAATFPDAVRGVIAMAPHILVEDVTVKHIELARENYRNADLRDRISRYHNNPDSAFWGWNDIWLAPEFRDWNIGDLLPAITCPILAIQGEGDPYGTMAQIDGIAARARRVELLKLKGAGHSPHRDQPDRIIETVRQFVLRNT